MNSTLSHMKFNFIKVSMTLFLVLPFCVSAQNAPAKPAPKVVLKNDTVYTNGKAQFICKIREAKSDSSNKMVSLKDMNGKLEALLSMTGLKDTTRFSGRFITSNKAYDCYYPRIGVQTILESYVKNGIMNKDKIDTVALAAYCAERNIPLRSLPRRESARPGTDPKRDSIMAANAKARKELQFSFTLVNKYSRSIMVFLGDTTATKSNNPKALPFRQGRYEYVEGNASKTLVGFEGEFVSISNKSRELKDTRALTKKIKSITVKEDGVSFVD